MKLKLTRRNAIITGASAAGAAMSGFPKKSDAATLPDVWGADFLPQWSPPQNVKRNLTPGKTPIRLCCTAYGFSNTEGKNPADQVKGIRDMGYTAAEAFHLSWRMMKDSELREFNAALKQHDILFYNIHVWTNIIQPNKEERLKNQREVVHAIEMAEQMGIKFILTHTGSLVEGKPGVAHKNNWTKETWEMSVAALKQILADTSGSKVNLAIEAVNTTNCNSPESHIRLKKDVGSDRIKVTLDPTNMLFAGNVFRSTELINNCFEIIPEDDIMYCHAKDVKWTEMLPGLNWVVPGQGEMDYDVYLTHLSRMKYPRPLMLEFLKRDQYPEAKKFIEETAAKNGVKIYG